jgi:hypothetical protein
MTEGPLRVCQFLRGDHAYHSNHPLTELNKDETPGDIEYYTIRGSFDELYWLNRDSPKLDGAEANVALPTGHDGVREDVEARELICTWSMELLTPDER